MRLLFKKYTLPTITFVCSLTLIAALAVSFSASIVPAGASFTSAPIAETGQATVAHIEGQATANGQPITLGSTLKEADEIETQAGSRITLLLSNGAALDIGPGASLQLKTLRQEAYPSHLGSLEDLIEDPSPSQTEVLVLNGEVTAYAKPLHLLSTFALSTPAMTAGIRGTIVTLSHNTSTSQSRLRIIEGSVSASGNTGLSEAEQASTGNPEAADDALSALPGDATNALPPANAHTVNLSAGQELNVTRSVNLENGSATTRTSMRISRMSLPGMHEALISVRRLVSTVKVSLVTLRKTLTSIVRSGPRAGETTQRIVIQTQKRTEVTTSEKTFTYRVQLTQPTADPATTTTQNIEVRGTTTTEPSGAQVVAATRRSTTSAPAGNITQQSTRTTRTLPTGESTTTSQQTIQATSKGGQPAEKTYSATLTRTQGGLVSRTATSTYADADGTQQWNQTSETTRDADRGITRTTTTTETLPSGEALRSERTTNIARSTSGITRTESTTEVDSEGNLAQQTRTLTARTDETGRSIRQENTATSADGELVNQTQRTRTTQRTQTGAVLTDSAISQNADGTRSEINERTELLATGNTTTATLARTEIAPDGTQTTENRDTTLTDSQGRITRTEDVYIQNPDGTATLAQRQQELNIWDASTQTLRDKQTITSPDGQTRSRITTTNRSQSSQGNIVLTEATRLVEVGSGGQLRERETTSSYTLVENGAYTVEETLTSDSGEREPPSTNIEGETTPEPEPEIIETTEETELFETVFENTTSETQIDFTFDDNLRAGFRNLNIIYGTENSPLSF